MTRLDSPLKDRMIFNVGARRSGTWWLQRMVTAHPEVAAVPVETHLFSLGVHPLHERFHHGARESILPGFTYIGRDELLDATRDFCDRVFAQWMEGGVRFVAERTPLHVLHLDLIADVYPDAWVVHIIRDGRDVTRSLVSRHFGPATIEAAAGEWSASVQAGLRARGRERYIEVRYEDLLRDPEHQLRALYARLGLDSSREAVAAGLDEHRSAASVDPADPRVGAGKWRGALTAREFAAVERIAGDLLAELGYLEDARSSIQAERPSRRVLDKLAGGTRRTRQVVRRVRRLAAPFSDRSRESRTPAESQVLLSSLTNDVLACAHEARVGGLDELLDPSVVVEVVNLDDESHRRAAGAAGRAELARVLLGYAEMGGRQVKSELTAIPPTATAITSYELPDGTRTERVLVLTMRGERVGRLAFFELPVRRPESRTKG